MNPKIEKYYEYIADDMFKNTTWDYGENKLWLFGNFFVAMQVYMRLNEFDHPKFYNIIKNRYGVREEEVNTIHSLWKRKIRF